MNSTPPTWEDFARIQKALEEYRSIDGPWFMYVHPDLLKHHPTARYLRRYARRTERRKKLIASGRIKVK